MNKRYANSIVYLVSLLLPVGVGLIMFVLAFLATVISALSDKSSKMGLGDALVAGLMFGLMGGLFWFLILLIVPLLAQQVLYLVETYRMWNAINDGKSRMTPGKAIGYLFIPVYGIYWMFQVWGGFPADYNAYLNRYHLQNKVPPLDNNLHQLVPILLLTSVFIIPIPVLMIVFYFVLGKNNIALANLKNAVSESRNQFPQTAIQNPGFQPQINSVR